MAILLNDLIQKIEIDEVWESTEHIVTRTVWGIKVERKDGKCCSVMFIATNEKFRPKRDYLEFTSIIASYENGEEIESVVTSNRYTKIGNNDFIWSTIGQKWVESSGFNHKEIRGKWYVNKKEDK